MINGYLDPAFARVAERFRRLYARPSQGGGALAVQLRGRPVVDVWAGVANVDTGEPWRAETMAMSFSTTKGVAATVVHRLRDRGLLDYDEPVATWWPEFAQAGKGHITVRELLSHRAGLHRVRGHTVTKADLLDEDRLIEQLAATAPEPDPEGRSGYHGFTFGWLVDGLVRGVTGEHLRDLVATEIVAPLDLDGLMIGAPKSERHRVAPLIERPAMTRALGFLADRAERTPRLRHLTDALVPDGFENLMHDEAILETSMPAVNGVFTARSLATMYAALANDGQVDGRAFLSADTVREAGRVQTRRRDYVIGIPMRWRLGYHRAFTAGRHMPPMGFGHFGFGGSGGWADPETGVSVGFVTNRLGSATTPFGDARLATLGALALSAAREVEATRV